MLELLHDIYFTETVNMTRNEEMKILMTINLPTIEAPLHFS